MYQLYFGCLFPTHLSRQEDKINDQTMETLSAPHEILSNWQEAKGESTIPSSTPSLHLCQFAWWYRGLLVHCKFYAHKNYRDYWKLQAISVVISLFPIKKIFFCSCDVIIWWNLHLSFDITKGGLISESFSLYKRRCQIIPLSIFSFEG